MSICWGGSLSASKQMGELSSRVLMGREDSDGYDGSLN